MNLWMSFRSKRLATAAGVLTACGGILTPTTRADEGGTSFWVPGQYASLAAVPPSPGFTLTTTVYYYQGSAGGNDFFARHSDLKSNVDAKAPTLFLTPEWAPDFKIFGGQPSFALTFVGGYQDVSADVTLLPSGLTAGRSDSLWGFGDLYPMASIAWNKGSNNFMLYLTGDIPVGSYDPDRLANIGLGHGAIDAGGAYTYFNQKTGLEFSATLGFTYNFENPDTDYTSGIDSHLDWAVSQFLNEHLHVGIVGYVYYQLTPDDYPTSGISGQLRKQALGDHQSGVAAVGPEVGFFFKIGDKQAYANLRGYYEFWAQNRLEGFSVFLNVQIPL